MREEVVSFLSGIGQDDEPRCRLDDAALADITSRILQRIVTRVLIGVVLVVLLCGTEGTFYRLQI